MKYIEANLLFYLLFINAIYELFHIVYNSAHYND